MTTKARKRYFVCLSNGGYRASLEVRKIYVVLPDAAASTEGLLRVIDESGEDYLYPTSLFAEIALPSSAARAFRAAS